MTNSNKELSSDVLHFMICSFTDVDNGDFYFPGFYSDGDFRSEMLEKFDGIEKNPILAKKVLKLVDEEIEKDRYCDDHGLSEKDKSVLLRSCWVAETIGMKCPILYDDAFSTLEKIEAVVEDNIEDQVSSQYELSDRLKSTRYAQELRYASTDRAYEIDSEINDERTQNIERIRDDRMSKHILKDVNTAMINLNNSRVIPLNSTVAKKLEQALKENQKPCFKGKERSHR